MGKRFSRLDYAMKLLQDPSRVDDENATPVEPPAGSALDNYAKFLTGKKKLEVNYPDDSKPGSIITVGIRAFGLPATANNSFLVPISERANEQKKALMEATHNHLKDVDNLVENASLTPAKAIIFRAENNATAQVKTSSITGLKYKRIAGVSFTIPFGAAETGDEAYELPARTAIVQQLDSNQNLNLSVSFEPEHFRRR